MTAAFNVGAPVRWKKGRKADRRHTFTVRETGPVEIMIDNGTPGVPDFQANGATVMACVKPGEIEPWGDAPPKFTVTARVAYDLAAMTAERDRLARILAVERGDESRAPEGWRCGPSGWCVRGPDGQDVSMISREETDGPWVWWAHPDGGEGREGTAPSALEAMEAADAAREGSDV